MEINWDEYIYPAKAGEKQAKAALKAKGYKIQDVSNDSSYWFKDIDLICYKNDLEIRVEVKWDSRIGTTGNLFIEDYSNIETDRKGWFHYCEADFLMYGDSAANKFYFIPFPIVKKVIAENSFKQAKAYDFKNGEIWKTSSGWLVPITFLLDNYSIDIIEVN